MRAAHPPPAGAAPIPIGVSAPAALTTLARAFRHARRGLDVGLALNANTDANAELTARELGVHVNTVRHRLGRFEQATGRSLREVETLAEVWWALQSARLA